MYVPSICDMWVFMVLRFPEEQIQAGILMARKRLRNSILLRQVFPLRVRRVPEKPRVGFTGEAEGSSLPEA